MIALRASQRVPRQVGRKIRSAQAGAAKPAILKSVRYISELTRVRGAKFRLCLHPDPDRDQHQENRKRFLKLRARQALRQPRSDPRPEKQPEPDPQRLGDVEVSAPPILPRPEGA